jgi:ABC-type transport system involved in multi-copper enzyme maturation permease subunit
LRAILERDYTAETARPRAFAARAIFGGFAALTVLFVAGTGSAILGGSPDVVGREAFRIISRGTFLFLAAATPVLFVGSLLGERLLGTLDLLLVSPEGPRGVAAGKFVARLGTVLTWAAAALPPLTMAVLFGGTSWRELFNLAAGLLGSALELAAAGLVVSTLTRRMATAAVMAYLLPALHWLPALAEVPGGGGGWWATLRATTPIPWLDLPEWDRSLQALGASPLATLLGQPGIVHLLLGAALALAAVPLCARGLAREEPVGSGGSVRRFRGPRPALEVRLRHALTAGNPVAWKESLLLNTAWSRFLYYLVAGILIAGEIVFLVLLDRGQWDPETDLWFVAISVSLVAGLACVQGAASMVFEKSQGSFDLLRVTRLTPAQIARGKVLGTMLGTFFLLLIPLGHILVTTVAGERAGGEGGIRSQGAAALAALLAVVLCANGAIHGLTWGVLARTPWAALAGAAAFVAVGFGSCFALCAVPFVLSAIHIARKEAPTDFFEIIVIPAALCGSPSYVLRFVVGAADGIEAAIGAFLGVGCLGATLVYGLYRWHRLPEVLEWQMERMAEGPRPGLGLPVPPPPRRGAPSPGARP